MLANRRCEVTAISTRTTNAILYAPTLTSGGGFVALNRQLAAESISVAVVIAPEKAVHYLPFFEGVRFVATRGHLHGLRLLRQIRREYPACPVFAAQNPVLSFGRLEWSLIQNHLAARPVTALLADPSPRSFLYLLMTVLLTSLQVARSRSVIVLNSYYPLWWRWSSTVTVRANELPQNFLRSQPQSKRSRKIVVVTSWDRFRGAHVVLRAFAESGLGKYGWSLEIFAPLTVRTRYYKACRRWLGVPGVSFREEGADTHEALATCAVAVYASSVEGSSIAFLEGLALADRIVALDAPHYREAAMQADVAGRVTWVRSWRSDGWCRALVAIAQQW